MYFFSLFFFIYPYFHLSSIFSFHHSSLHNLNLSHFLVFPLLRLYSFFPSPLILFHSSGYSFFPIPHYYSLLIFLHSSFLFTPNFSSLLILIHSSVFFTPHSFSHFSISLLILAHSLLIFPYFYICLSLFCPPYCFFLFINHSSFLMYPSYLIPQPPNYHVHVSYTVHS